MIARRELAGQRAAERDAHDRQRDGERPLAPRHVLRRERGRVRHRAAEPDTRQEAQHAEHLDTQVANATASVSTAKVSTLADQRGAPADAIAQDAAEQAADHHAERPERERVGELVARPAPLLDQRRHGIRQELVVDAVEDDREPRAGDQQLLVSRPRPPSSNAPTSTVFIAGGSAPERQHRTGSRHQVSREAISSGTPLRVRSSSSVTPSASSSTRRPAGVTSITARSV